MAGDGQSESELNSLKGGFGVGFFKHNAPLFLVFLVFVVGALVYFLVWQKPMPRIPTASREAGNALEVEVKDGELLANFPDVPVYPGATIDYSYSQSGTQAQAYEGHWEAQSSVGEITQWYLDNLVADGWEILDEVEEVFTVNEHYFQARKGDLIANFIIECESCEGTTEIYVEIPYADNMVKDDD